MGFYSRFILPRLIDSACSQPPLTELRRAFVPQATGRVLEIGIGSGLNLPLYGDIESLTGLEPNPSLTSRAQARARNLGFDVNVLAARAEEIPAAAKSFDSIVCTWTLCSVSDPQRALSEMRRVLRPEGKLYFIEHGLAPDEPTQAWQRRLNRIWGVIGGGCQLNRNIPELIRRAELTALKLETGFVPGPRFAAFMYRGIAVA
jgi:ubiquinone/menaquinone biosynthesis C-methylase UbiE